MRAIRTLLFSAAASVALLANISVDAGAGTQVAISYVPNSLAEASIAAGPWTLHQMARGNPHDASGILPTEKTPFNPPTTAFGTPYKNYCVGGKVQTAQGVNPMQPYYFPFVRQKSEFLEGFFDYRPRNHQEATVAAISFDRGRSWIFKDEALGLNPFCPADPTDPDNNNVIVNGFSTPYGSDPNNAGDNGLGHSFVMKVGGVERIYHLNRANNHIDHDQLVVHRLRPKGTFPLAGQPAFGYVSPLAADGYPELEATAEATIGLESPDAILGAATIDGMTTIVYVEKQLGGAPGSPVLTAAQTCPSTPSFALTNHVVGKPRKANNDVITIRVATTTDGITFEDVGTASGLQDPISTALNAIRWLGSGSIVRLANGHFGLFFGAGNCLDNDSDGFHFLGYAETVSAVESPSDLLSWTVIRGFDNPILSTDTVTDPVADVTYPAHPPLVDVSGADVLTAAQVAPWVPTGGFNTNFFSGRAYDPQAIPVDDATVTIVFAGYNTPQPSSNLGDYRTIGRFQLRFPDGYFARPDRDDEDSDRDSDRSFGRD
jgi:hypothetical protein